MTKKKSIISLILAFCLIIPAMFMLTSCGSNNTLPKLSNDNSGIEIVGEFEEGSKLNTNKVESTSNDANDIFVKLEGRNIKITDKSKAIIYDIFVSKDDQKVQPNGKVTVSVPVSVPVTENAGGYKVFHIKDDNTVEELTATYKDGILTFETSSFSYYVFVSTDAVDINPTPSNPTNPDTPDDSGDDSTTQYTFKASVKEYTGVEDIGTISENDVAVDLSEGRQVADGTKITLTATAKEGYALKGWYKVEGATETLLSCATTYEFTVNENMNIKAVFDEKVTLYIQAEGRIMGTDAGSLIFKAKGITEERHGDFTMEVAKGTEVTIEAIPCRGWVFEDWYYRFYTGASTLIALNANSQYTFTASQDIVFRANANGVPKKLEFTLNSSSAIFGSRGFENVNGEFIKTITVGTTLQEYIYTDVHLFIYIDDDNNYNSELTLNNGFTIEVDKNLDTSKVGKYEIKYIYTGWYPEGQEPVTLSIFINVVADTTE